MRRKKRWQLLEQRYPEDPDGIPNDEEAVWRSKYSSWGPLEDKVREVLEDQATRSQVLKLSEEEAKKRCPNIVVASLGAQRKDEKNGTYTARVLFDGTNGISVLPRTSRDFSERGQRCRRGRSRLRPMWRKLIGKYRLILLTGTT